MNNRDLQIISHICLHCKEAIGFIKRFGDDYKLFVSDRAYFNAVAMSILQIGELANALSDEYRESTKNEIPWNMVRGMRNALAHGYSSIDADVLWQTAKNDIPMLFDFCDSQITK